MFTGLSLVVAGLVSLSTSTKVYEDKDTKIYNQTFEKGSRFPQMYTIYADKETPIEDIVKSYHKFQEGKEQVTIRLIRVDNFANLNATKLGVSP